VRRVLICLSEIIILNSFKGFYKCFLVYCAKTIFKDMCKLLKVFDWLLIDGYATNNVIRAKGLRIDLNLHYLYLHAKVGDTSECIGQSRILSLYSMPKESLFLKYLFNQFKFHDAKIRKKIGLSKQFKFF